MTRRLLLLATLAAVSFAAPPAKKSPKLLLVVVVDQFRYDYLTRFGPEYKAGLARLLHEGAVFTNANYEHFPTVTAIGHSTVLTGATPSVSGIVGNEWFDRETGKNVTSVSDDDTKLLGAPGDRRGASPRRLLVSTVADEIKLAARGNTSTIGISAKDRAAILVAGPHGGRRLLVRCEHRQLRQQHLLLQDHARVGHHVQRKPRGGPLAW